MKKFRVTARSVGLVEVFIEAKDKKQALAIAKNVDGFDWKEYSSDWHILEAEEQKKVKKAKP
jgi:hypothetical protein